MKRMKKIDDKKGDLKRGKEKVSEVFGMKTQAFLYIRSKRVYNFDLCQKGVCSALVLGFEILFWKKGSTCDTMQRMVEYRATGDVVCLHPALTNVTAKTPRVSRESALYWNEGTRG